MQPDPYALSNLLRSLGIPAREIARRYNAAHPMAPLSTPAVESWMRPPGASRKPGRPRWDVLAGLADALNIPRATLFAACAGTVPDSEPVRIGILAAREEVDAARRWWASHVGISEGEQANMDRTVAEALAGVVARIDLLDPEMLP